MSEFTPDNPSSMEYTMLAKDVENLRKLISDKRHPIGRDQSVLEGIYAGSYGGEAIVVDYEKDPEYYDAIVDVVIDKATNQKGTLDKAQVLDSVFETVTEFLPYSQELVDDVNARYGIKDFQKISLSVYIHEKAGVCRHQALLVATILEILKKRSIIRGNASMERSIQWPEDGDPEGHAWVRYTNGSGEIFIIDIAQQFIGTLEESKSRKRGWNYLRPNEIAESKPKLPIQLGKSASAGLITGVPDYLK